MLPLFDALAEASFGIFRSSAVAFASVSSMVWNASPWGIFSEQGAGERHSERDAESTVVGWRQDCFSRQGIGSQQAMCSSMRPRDAETTRNKLRTDKSHLQIVGKIAWMDPWEMPASCSNSTMVIFRLHWISCRTFSIRGNAEMFWLSYV